MEIRTEQRDEVPVNVEDIGLGAWHLRWNIQEKTTEDERTYYEYSEVTLDHKPTATEIKNITAQ